MLDIATNLAKLVGRTQMINIPFQLIHTTCPISFIHECHDHRVAKRAKIIAMDCYKSGEYLHDILFSSKVTRSLMHVITALANASLVLHKIGACVELILQMFQFWLPIDNRSSY